MTDAEMLELADKIATIYERVKLFPENQPDGGFMDLIALRNLAHDAEQMLRRHAATLPSDDDEDQMVKISALIARLKSTMDQFGDTCVYIRRGGLSWGAVALNRRDDDRKHGVFDLQAQHDRDLLQRVEQVERLIASKNSWMESAMKAEAAAQSFDRTREPSDAMVDAAAREMWNDRDARMGGAWDSRDPSEVCVIQTKATARAAIIAALAVTRPDGGDAT